MKASNNRSGQALVEFALVISVFCLILVGIVDVGRMLYTKHMLDKATREGARAGVVISNVDLAKSTSLSIAQSILGQLNLSPGPSVQASIVTVNGVDAVRVSANYVFTSTFSSTHFPIIPSVNLTSNSTMRKEG